MIFYYFLYADFEVKIKNKNVKFILTLQTHSCYCCNFRYVH